MSKRTFYCYVCGKECSRDAEYANHLRNKSHIDSLPKKDPVDAVDEVDALVKNIKCLKVSGNETATAAASHSMLAALVSSLHRPTPPPVQSTQLSCSLCQLNFNSPTQREDHMKSNGHRNKQMQGISGAKTTVSNGVGGQKTAVAKVTPPTPSLKGAASAVNSTIKLSTKKGAGSTGMDLKKCGVCVKEFTGHRSAIDHYISEQHKKKAAGIPQPKCLTSCFVCALSFTGSKPALEHYDSEKHKTKMARR